MMNTLQDSSFQTILGGIEFFLIRNYRKRLFKQSKDYKKYLEHIEHKPQEKSQLKYGSSSIEEEHRVLTMFSKIISPEINKKCLDVYNLSLIDLMMDEDITCLLDAIESIYNIEITEEEKTTTMRMDELCNIFYRSKYYSFNVNTNPFDIDYYHVRVDIDLMEKSQIDLYNKIKNKNHKITIKEIINIEVSKNFKEECKKKNIDFEKIENEYIYCNEDIYTNEYILLPMDSKINDICKKITDNYHIKQKAEGEIKIIYKPILSTKDENILKHELKHMIKIRKLIHFYNFNNYYNENMSETITNIGTVLPLLQLKNTENKYSLENILKKNFIYDIIYHDIHELDKPQVWDNIKSRVIGLHLYDIVDPQKITVPIKVIRDDKVLRKYGYTAEEKARSSGKSAPKFTQKLTNYLKTARRCVENGMIMPTKS